MAAINYPRQRGTGLGVEDKKIVRYEIAAIESLNNETLLQHVFTTDKVLFRMKVTPPGTQVSYHQFMERTVYQGWVFHEDEDKEAMELN